MDLLANYASSDEEEEESPQKQKLQSAHFKPSKNSTEILSRLPENDDEDDDLLSVDKNSSMFSLPPPKFSSSIISSLPAPNASKADPFKLPVPLASSEPKLKRVVQFKPPTISSGVKDNTADEDDDDDEEEDEKERRKKVSESATQNLSVKSFLSSLPAPKSSGTLGALPLGSGTGRKSILEADVPASDSNGLSVGTEVGFNSNVGYYEGQSVSSSGAVDGGFQSESVDPVGVEGGYTQWATQGEDYSSYQGYTGYGNDYSHFNMVYAPSYADYGQFEHNSVDGSNVSAQELPESAESALRVTGKRGRRNDAPQEIVEVKQDELMKNRPREDKARLTGIAFGPSYKAASTKGKPSKLHKRKHQISSLYFDMRQKEMELAERRARGMLTKAQTQGKYGW